MFYLKNITKFRGQTSIQKNKTDLDYKTALGNFGGMRDVQSMP